MSHKIFTRLSPIVIPRLERGQGPLAFQGQGEGEGEGQGIRVNNETLLSRTPGSRNLRRFARKIPNKRDDSVGKSIGG